MRTHSLAWSPRPTIAHDHIAGNLERMLNNCLERYAPSLLALQRPRLELGSSHYRPQADVGVIDIGYEAGQRFVEKAYLLAEVSSEADEVVVPGTDRKWIDVKREIYRSHGHCEAVLVVAHDRMEVETNLKTETGWKSSVATGRDAEVLLVRRGRSLRRHAAAAPIGVGPAVLGDPVGSTAVRRCAATTGRSSMTTRIGWAT